LMNLALSRYLGKPVLNRTPPVGRGDFGYICFFIFKN
jgi:hypothetical protein